MARASGSRDFDKKKPRLKRRPLEAGLAREQEAIGSSQAQIMFRRRCAVGPISDIGTSKSGAAFRAFPRALRNVLGRSARDAVEPVARATGKCIEALSDPMRELIEDLWPKLAHKLPPKNPQG
jgi:hypothetical protein